jgi:uncharacterized cupin superfamily protein
MTEKPTNKTNSIPHLLKASDIEAMPEKMKVHPINKEAVRHTKFLSDALEMKNLGIRLVRVEPGKETTQFHFHYHEEEFIYIISGKGIAQIGEQEIEIAAGDFMGFTAPSLPHAMKNTSDEDLVYLMGGERNNFDIADYPKTEQRLIRFNGERKLVDWQDLKEFRKVPEEDCPRN